jgi:hypothetical protein
MGRDGWLPRKRRVEWKYCGGLNLASAALAEYVSGVKRCPQINRNGKSEAGVTEGTERTACLVLGCLAQVRTVADSGPVLCNVLYYKRDWGIFRAEIGERAWPEVVDGAIKGTVLIAG